MKVSNEVLTILESCTTQDNILFLPTHLDRKTYIAVNKCLETIGGQWDRKVQGHVFDSDPALLVENMILTGEMIDLKKEYQYFPTPPHIVRKMIELAEIEEHNVMLEPSAGQGNIMDVLITKGVACAVELNPTHVKVLKDKGYNVWEGDFLQFTGKEFGVKFNRIVMNPPFSRQQDIDHIYHAFDILAKGGILVSVISEAPFFRQNKKSLEFQEWLNNHYATVIILPEGSFKDSGTMVKSRIIKVTKNK